ncbi:hypothetical protein AbraIFM66951_010573, partial [Aspergillus brasiliensis]
MTFKRNLSTTRVYLNENKALSRQSVISKLTLEDKVTCVTGGSRGIGLELAKITAALGSHVAILDVTEPEVSIQQLEKDYGSRFTFH